MIATLAASLLPAQGGTWSATGSLATARSSHASASLPGGDVLVAGGYDGTPSVVASAERYVSATGTWLPLPPMSQPRVYPTATALTNGTILVVGGGGGATAQVTAELFDPATNTWSPAAPPPFAFMVHDATRLVDGRVLVVGGMPGGTPQAIAAIFDPVAGSWAVTGSLNVGRHNFRAVTLVDGRVLVAGGALGVAGGYASIASCEIWSPVTGTWTMVGNMAAPRSGLAVARLRDGRVLLTGGGIGGYAGTATADLFDPFTDAIVATGSMLGARGGHASMLLPDGRVLVAGGFHGATFHVSHGTAELYDPISGTFTGVGSLAHVRAAHSANLLPNGSVLVTGGRDFVPNTTVAVAEVFTLAPCGPVTAYGVPSPGLFTPTITGSGCARTGQTITLSANGAPFAGGLFAMGSFPLNVVYNGLTILQSLDVTLVIFLDAGGGWSLPVAIPANPTLANVHCYFQAAFYDPSTPSSFNATAGLDVQIL